MTQKERDKKYLIIGSIGHQFVDCVDWVNAHSYNLVDYDVIIANVQSLTEAFLMEVPCARIETLRTLLTRFLASDGRLIILSDHKKIGKNEKRYPVSYDNYSWSPIDIEIKKEKGDTINVITNFFPEFFSKFREWEYYFCSPRNCLTTELTDYLGKTYEYDYSWHPNPYLQNREKRMLAGEHYWSVRPKGSKNNVRNLGAIVLLPLLKNIHSREAINLLIKDIIGKTQGIPPPEWLKEVRIPILDDIIGKIRSHENTIVKQEKIIEELNQEKANLEYYKKLLYCDGQELEDVFKKCLIGLGASVNTAKYAEEEYCLVYDKNEYPVEVKGNTKSISLTDLRQLMDYLLVYDEKTDKSNKGILLGNAWKGTPVNGRGSKEKPIFPSNVIKRSEVINIALVSSVDFFKVFCFFLENKSLGKKILNCIVGSKGVVDFRKIK